MPWKTTLDRARRDRRQGKAATTQAGEFVREEMEHVRRDMHGARSARQAIAIGLNKARRAGVALKPPRPGQASEKTRRAAESASRHGRSQSSRRPNPRRSRAATRALEREGRSAASRRSLSRQAHSAAARRRRSGASSRSGRSGRSRSR